MDYYYIIFSFNKNSAQNFQTSISDICFILYFKFSVCGLPLIG